MKSKLHIDCLPKKVQKTLLKIKPIITDNHFILGGGTALALQIGHRISIDLDFFTQMEFSTEAIYQKMKKMGLNPQVLQEEKGTFTAAVQETMISIFHYPYPFLDTGTELNRIPIAGVLDIASMKVIAIGQRGAKRDFVDLYFILQDEPFWKVAENTVQRFGKERINPIHIGKSLVYFNDADSDPEPNYLLKNAPDWKTVKNFFVKNVQQMVIDMQKAI